jgi:hypothetical protein
MNSLIVKFFAILFLFSGILALIFPKASWWLQTGWQFKDAEPSSAALVMARIMGIVSIGVAAFLFFHILPNFKP